MAGCMSIQAQMPSQALPRVRALLTIKPLETKCRTVQGQTVRCVILLQSDYEAIVIELKRSCLELGGTKKECDADADN